MLDLTLGARSTIPFVEEAKQAFTALLGDRVPTGPFTVIFHGIVDGDDDPLCDIAFPLG